MRASIEPGWGRTVTVGLFVLRALAALCVIVPLVASATIAGVALAGAAALLVAGSVVRWTFLLLIADAETRPAPSGVRVALVTSFVPGAESLPMLERTLTAMKAVAYPHDTWLLDEGDDDDARELCRRLDVRHFSRRQRPEYQAEAGPLQRNTKHGNYNAWLTEIGFARYDVLAALDPDHVPAPTFLDDTLGQLADPRIAYVQSPQEYYNRSASLVARGSAEELLDFYWITQRAYHRFRTPSVIGSHGVHRIQALQEMGGLAPHVADDLLLTLRYHLADWRGAYVAKVLARGLAPVDWVTYLTQQRRWARSLLDVKLRIFPRLARGMSVPGRIVGLLQGLSYLQDGLAALCAAVAAGAVLIAGVPPSLMSALLQPWVAAGAGVLLLTGLYPHLFHGPHRNAAYYWRAGVLRLVKWPYTLLALGDVIRNRDRGYDLTGKSDRPEVRDLRLLWPHLALAALVGTCWAIALAVGNTPEALAHAVAALALLPSLLVLIAGLRSSPAAYDPLLADGRTDDRQP